MNLEERTYSVLIVTASPKFYDAVAPLLSAFRCGPVRCVSDLSSAKRLRTEQEFDFVIINSPLPDDPGIRFAIDLCRETSAAVLLLVPGDIHEQIRDKVMDHGVFTLAKPVGKNTFAIALGWMAAARERTRKTEKKTLSVEEKMEEIRLVNRAKWLLIHELGMDEPEAHRHIVRQAMDRSLTKAEIARQIINMYS